MESRCFQSLNGGLQNLRDAKHRRHKRMMKLCNHPTLMLISLLMILAVRVRVQEPTKILLAIRRRCLQQLCMERVAEQVRSRLCGRLVATMLQNLLNLRRTPRALRSCIPLQHKVVTRHCERLRRNPPARMLTMHRRRNITSRHCGSGARRGVE